MGEPTDNTLRAGTILPFDMPGSDLASIAAGAAQGETDSILLLHDRFGPLVHRLVWRLLGADREHNDVVHDVFVRILGSIGSVRDPARLERWICGVAVNTVHSEIRRRRLWRLFHLVPAGEAPCAGAGVGLEWTLAPRFYAALETVAVDDRIAFILRYVESMELDEVAAACGVSLATAKRRIARARSEFRRRAARDPLLSPYTGDGDE